MDNYLSSTQNPKIKKLLALQQKSALRRETGLFVVEGRREIQQCIDSGYEIDTLYIRAKENEAVIPADLPSGINTCFVSPHVYERIAYHEVHVRHVVSVSLLRLPVGRDDNGLAPLLATRRDVRLYALADRTVQDEILCFSSAIIKALRKHAKLTV